RVLAGQARAVFVTAVQDLQQRATGQIGSTAVLDEPTRPHARAEPRCARMRYGFDLAIENRLLPRLGVGAAESEQAQEMRLARTVRPEHRDPIAEVRLEIERSRQTGQFQSLTVQCPLAGAPTAQPHLKANLAWPLLGRTGLLEAAQPGQRCTVPGGHVRGVCGPRPGQERKGGQLGARLAQASWVPGQ